MSFLNFNNVLVFLILFIPGFVSIKVHDLLIASDKRDFSKSVLEIMAYSAINLALLSWLILPILHYKLYENYPIVFCILAFFIGCIFPAFLPIIYIKIINNRWLAKHIAHPIKRPWDWFFSKKNSFWVIITLKDGRKIGGVFSNKSYASSFPAPEQIYLEEIWKLDEKDHFLAPVKFSKGVIILGKDMSTLEFLSNKGVINENY